MHQEQVIAAPHAAGPAGLVTGSSAIVVRATSPVLVGRSAELRALVDVASQPPAVVLLEGEAGIGKSRLVQELLQQPELRRHWAAVGWCQPLREPFPYGPIVDALGNAAEQLDRLQRAGRTLNPVVGALRPLLDEIADQLPPMPESLGDARAERHRMFRAIRELLSTCGPTLLVVEDLHWADEGTRDVLNFLVAQPADNVCVLATYRPEEPAAVPLTGAHRQGPGTTSAVIRLAPLDEGHVSRLTAALVGEPDVSSDFAGRLFHRTAGIPFVVEETLHALRDPAGAVRSTGSAAESLLDSVEVPTLLRQGMADRLDRLSPEAVLVAQAAAVLAVPASAALVGAVADLSEMDTDEGIVAALRAGVLVEASPNRYGFRHALARQAVYDALDGPYRRGLHARAASVLRGEPELPLVQIAKHLRAAEQIGEWLATAERAAAAAHDNGDSALACELLLELIDEPTISGDQVNRVARSLGAYALGMVGSGGMIATLGQLLEDPRLTGPTRGELRFHRGLLALRRSGSLDAGRADLEQAVAQMADSNPASALLGMSVLAVAQFGETPAREAERWLPKVARGIQETADLAVRFSASANHMHTLIQLGDPDGLNLAADLPERAADAEERRALTRAHANVADACGWVGYFRPARRFLRISRELADAGGGVPYVCSVSDATGAHLDWWTGQWQGLSQRSEDLLERYIDVQIVADELSLVLASLAIAAGEWDSALTRLDRPGLRSAAESCAPMVISAAAARARLHLSRDEVAEAVLAVRGAISLARRKGVWVWAAELLPVAVEAFCRSGDVPAARVLVDSYGSGIVGRSAPLAHAGLLHGLGILHSYSGESRAAVARLTAAADAYAALPAPYDAALAAERAVVVRGADAAHELGPLAETFTALGATRDAARCQHALRGHGNVVRSRRGRRGYGDELSPREKDVARLLARGHSNREIAEVLFLSPRTVEHHVARVLHKSGARSRADLRES
ncbi:ATP-binding protein [Fodinicola acaciae]|uniref:ATP-binding protein n=1 Tax=Fodinicola acaciae TaxID=2681555 RepID=UPI0013D223EC|nr:LuxR family transcriptional regulator [Fodinicola acaciae]